LGLKIRRFGLILRLENWNQILCEFMKVEEPIVAYESLDQSQSYTYWDYLKWQFTERVELIRGKIFKMSPAPGTRHQSMVVSLVSRFAQLFQQQTCRVFVSPFDVRLPVPNSTSESTVVQPDICVVCDASKLDERGCNGAPDLVVEIVSPHNARHDTVTKFQLYEASGVKEYWIVQPETKHIFIYSLENGRFIGQAPITEGQKIKSPLFAVLEMDVMGIFPAD